MVHDPKRCSLDELSFILKKGKTIVRNRLSEEYTHIQERMGCDETCIFCDVKVLGKGPCCTYPGKLDVCESLERGRCLKKRGVSEGLIQKK